uniref:Uncharacterized protein n=1 Tax=Macrostomum lignano TaxID=282301 RepID=A0A1I8FHR4_9PLAT
MLQTLRKKYIENLGFKDNGPSAGESVGRAPVPPAGSTSSTCFRSPAAKLTSPLCPASPPLPPPRPLQTAAALSGFSTWCAGDAATRARDLAAVGRTSPLPSPAPLRLAAGQMRPSAMRTRRRHGVDEDEEDEKKIKKDAVNKLDYQPELQNESLWNDLDDAEPDSDSSLDDDDELRPCGRYFGSQASRGSSGKPLASTAGCTWAKAARSSSIAGCLLTNGPTRWMTGTSDGSVVVAGLQRRYRRRSPTLSPTPLADVDNVITTGAVAPPPPPPPQHLAQQHAEAAVLHHAQLAAFAAVSLPNCPSRVNFRITTIFIG